MRAGCPDLPTISTGGTDPLCFQSFYLATENATLPVVARRSHFILPEQRTRPRRSRCERPAPRSSAQTSPMAASSTSQTPRRTLVARGCSDRACDALTTAITIGSTSASSFVWLRQTGAQYSNDDEPYAAIEIVSAPLTKALVAEVRLVHRHRLARLCGARRREAQEYSTDQGHTRRHGCANNELSTMCQARDVGWLSERPTAARANTRSTFFRVRTSPRAIGVLLTKAPSC